MKTCTLCGTVVQALPPLDFLCPGCWDCACGRVSCSEEKICMLAGMMLAHNLKTYPPHTITVCARVLDPPWKQMFVDMERELHETVLSKFDSVDDLFEPRET